MAFQQFIILRYREMKDSTNAIIAIVVDLRIEDDAAPMHPDPPGPPSRETFIFSLQIDGTDLEGLPPSDPGRSNAILAKIRAGVAQAHQQWIVEDIPNRPMPPTQYDDAEIITHFGAKVFDTL